eukprot:2297339-Pleurochrysis_carterae.AAC.2
MVLVEGGWHAFWQHTVGVGSYVHVEEVGNWALVFDVPARGKSCGERGVQGVRSIIGVEHE